jgi:serine/threonine protein phosphatase PrpC
LLSHLGDYIVDPQQVSRIQQKLRTYTTQEHLEQISQSEGIELQDRIKQDWETRNLHEILNNIQVFTQFPDPPPGRVSRIGNRYLSRDRDWFVMHGKDAKEGKVIIPEAVIFRHSNLIFQALGRETAAVRLQSEPVLPGDRLLLISDGVYEALTDTEMEAILNERAEAREAAKMLIDEAQRMRTNPPPQRARWSADDQTAVVVEVR